VTDPPPNPHPFSPPHHCVQMEERDMAALVQQMAQQMEGEEGGEEGAMPPGGRGCFTTTAILTHADCRCPPAC
jgi:hypothetical protein